MVVRIEKVSHTDLQRLRTWFRDHVERQLPDIDTSYFSQHTSGQDVTLLATNEERAAGYLTLRKVPLHDYYRQRNVALIQDIWVFDDFQRRGIGNALIEEAEGYLRREQFNAVAVTVGLMASYGPAQRLYIRRGYVPDGRGVMRGNLALQEGDPVDHDTVLWLVKDLRQQDQRKERCGFVQGEAPSNEAPVRTTSGTGTAEGGGPSEVSYIRRAAGHPISVDINLLSVPECTEFQHSGNEDEHG